MRARCLICAVLLALVGIQAPGSPSSAVDLDAAGRVALAADFRVRFEADWDSQTAAGEARDDRHRARIRARLGWTLSAGENLKLGLRLRSGSEASHQSPHITVADFDGGDTGDADFNLDRWYLAAERGRLSAWVGRNPFPFWKQNELLWDDDATVAGLAGRLRRDLGSDSTGTLHLAYLTPPVGMRGFSGRLAGGQLVLKRRGPTAITVAAGYFDLEADPDDPDAARLLNGNGRRDYRLAVANARWVLDVHRRPLAIGADLFHNAEGYDAGAPDPFTAAHHDDTDGWALSLRWGDTAKPGRWLLGATHARIETLAVNSSYAQDDWVRWGTSSETRATGFAGQELRFGRALGPRTQLLARLYLVDAIASREDGSRFRVDFNYRF